MKSSVMFQLIEKKKMLDVNNVKTFWWSAEIMHHTCPSVWWACATWANIDGRQLTVDNVGQRYTHGHGPTFLTTNIVGRQDGPTAIKKYRMKTRLFSYCYLFIICDCVLFVVTSAADITPKFQTVSKRRLFVTSDVNT